MKLKSLLAATLALGLSSTAVADDTAFTHGGEAVDYRQNAFQLLRANFGYMADMVRGDREFDGAMFEERAQAVYHMSYIPWDGFKHAGENYTENSDALPALWENWDDVAQRAASLSEDARALAEAAASHDMGTIQPAFMDVARNCQQCHDEYRAD